MALTREVSAIQDEASTPFRECTLRSNSMQAKSQGWPDSRTGDRQGRLSHLINRQHRLGARSKLLQDPESSLHGCRDTRAESSPHSPFLVPAYRDTSLAIHPSPKRRSSSVPHCYLAGVRETLGHLRSRLKRGLHPLSRYKLGTSACVRFREREG